MGEGKEKWFAVVNPHAGSGRTGSVWKRAENLLSSHGIGFVSSETSCERHATEIAYTAAVEGYRKFIAVGGDGTIHEVLCGIAGAIGNSIRIGERMQLSSFYLAVIPVGSGNDWIRTHGIPHDVDTVADLIKNESFALQDVASVTVLNQSKAGHPVNVPGPVSYMVNIGGAGLDAGVCERVNRQKNQGKTGRILYIKSLIYNLIHHKPSPLRVECDGRCVYEGDCLSIAFGIGSYCGGGLRQTPEAVPDDGLLDYTIIPGITLIDAFRDGPKLFNGTFNKAGIVVTGRCRSVTVTPLSANDIRVEVDGEIIGNLPVRIEILPQQINVLHAYRP